MLSARRVGLARIPAGRPMSALKAPGFDSACSDHRIPAHSLNRVLLGTAIGLAAALVASIAYWRDNLWSESFQAKTGTIGPPLLIRWVQSVSIVCWAAVIPLLVLMLVAKERLVPNIGPRLIVNGAIVILFLTLFMIFAVWILVVHGIGDLLQGG